MRRAGVPTAIKTRSHSAIDCIITGAEGQPALFHVLVYQFRQARLIDGYDTFPEFIDPGGIDIDTGDVWRRIRQNRRLKPART